MAEFITESARVVPNQLGPTPLDRTARYGTLMAKAFGGDNYFVSNYDEMKIFFARAVDSGRPNIINVQIAPSMGKENLGRLLEICKSKA